MVSVSVKKSADMGQLDSIAVSVFVVILVVFDKYRI